jgi:hypothetical protein
MHDDFHVLKSHVFRRNTVRRCKHKLRITAQLLNIGGFDNLLVRDVAFLGIQNTVGVLFGISVFPQRADPISTTVH